MVIFFIFFVLFCIFLYLNRKADGFIFHPVRGPLPVTLPFEFFFLPEARGGKIHAAWLPPRPGMPVILFFHGRGGNITHFESFAARYAKYGYGVLMFDYRGFGKSSGRPGEARAYQDGCCALDYLLYHKHIPAEQIVIWGYSLGNAPALETAIRRRNLPFKAVILQSPFTSTPDIGAYWAARRLNGFKYTVLRAALQLLLCNKRFDNRKKIGRVTAPMLLGCSKQDELVPWQMSFTLARRAPQGLCTFCAPSGRHAEFAWFEAAAVNFLNTLNK